MQIIKRDGQEVLFDYCKIKKAILGAVLDIENKTLTEDIAEDIAKNIELICSKKEETQTVEQVQDLVEKELMKRNYYDVASAYIKYRYDRERLRKSNEQLMKRVEKKLFATDIENQNANVDEKSFGGRMGMVSDEVLKQYALDKLMSRKARRNHLNNEIYTHDLSSYPLGNHNCLTIPFDKLLANGFKTKQTDVRGANSINTAMQLVAVIFQLQSLVQFGGCAASSLDHTLVPYVRKSFYKHYLDGLRFMTHVDNPKEHGLSITPETPIDSENYKLFNDVYNYALEMTERETYQASEGLYHNLNTLQSRSGNQLPFTSINYGTCILPEGRMVIKALLEVSIAGLGDYHRTSIFPCGIFQYKKGINDKPGTPNYDLYQLALKSTSLRDYPNYANCDWSVNEGHDENDPKTYTATMGK